MLNALIKLNQEETHYIASQRTRTYRYSQQTLSYCHSSRTVSPSSTWAYRKLSRHRIPDLRTSLASGPTSENSDPLKYIPFGCSPRLAVSKAARSTSLADLVVVLIAPLGCIHTASGAKNGKTNLINRYMTRMLRRFSSLGMAPGSTATTEIPESSESFLIRLESSRLLFGIVRTYWSNLLLRRRE